MPAVTPPNEITGRCIFAPARVVNELIRCVRWLMREAIVGVGPGLEAKAFPKGRAVCFAQTPFTPEGYTGSMKVVEGDTFSINGTTGALDFKFRLLTWEDGLLITKGDQVADSVEAASVDVVVSSTYTAGTGVFKNEHATVKYLGKSTAGSDENVFTAAVCPP